MPIYVTVLKSTAEAVKGVGDVYKWYGESKKVLEKMGVRLIGAYALLGHYDMMFIYEARDERLAMSTALSSLRGTAVPTETWTAVPMDEFARLTARLSD